MNEQSLEGIRVLVVEDEAMIAMLIEDMLLDCGAVVVGPAATVAQALAAVEEHPIDRALLDVNLGGGEKSFAVAEALAKRNVPFLFATGYGQGGVNADFPNAPTLQKPFAQEALREALAKLGAR